MNSTQIKKIDRTKTLKLSKWQLFWHYFLLIIPLGMGLFSFYQFLEIKNTKTYNGIRTENEILVSLIIWISITTLILIVKKKRLNFKQVDVTLNETEFKEKMQEIAENENWNLTNNTKNFAVFHNGSDLTWGLKMTILRFEKYLLVNSICDPDSKSCISIFSENERNIKRFKKNLNKASR